MRHAKSLAALFAFLFLLGTVLLAQTKPFVGNKNSKKYHVVECTYAQKMNAKNRVEFSSAEEAEKAGYVACKICKPDQRNKKDPNP